MTGQHFKVMRELEIAQGRRKKSTHSPGEMVRIANRHEATRLQAQGYVVPWVYSFQGEPIGEAAREYAKTKRVGLWLFTSPHYSGGRIHMYQFAWCMANMGMEVYLITNCCPKWIRDYPKLDKLKILIDGTNPIPPDIDVVITDSKQTIGQKAWEYKSRNARIPLICFNFETPNWVKEFCPEYGSRLAVSSDLFNKADYLLANSRESRKWLLKWLKNPIECGILEPAVNTWGMKQKATLIPPANPYVVWSARHADYKGADVAMDAILELDYPMDLVCIGSPKGVSRETKPHRMHIFNGKSDGEKFELMRGAELVLAPSLFEGYGMVPGEALACGTPVIVYDLPVLRQEYGDKLIYVPWGDREKYKETVRKTLKDGHGIIESAEAQKQYGLEAMQAKIDDIKFLTFNRKKISAHLICYWGFIPQSIESIYEYADEIFVAYGPTEIGKASPPDGSLERLEAFPDPDNKIKIEKRDVWPDKLEMRESCVTQFSGNYHILLDGDEIWTGVKAWIDAGFDYGCPRWLNFWHDMDHWISDCAALGGSRWGKLIEPKGSTCPHYRWSYWRPTYHFRRHPTAVDMADKELHFDKMERIPSQVPEAIIYHLGHALSRSVMKGKHQFYRDRDGDDEGRQKRQKVWEDWKGEVGDIGDGIVKRVDWELPGIVQRAFEELSGAASE